MFKLRIEYYRVKKEMTQERLAELTGLSQGYISKLERQNRYESPTLSVLECIAEALEVCPKMLLECHCKYCK